MRGKQENSHCAMVAYAHLHIEWNANRSMKQQSRGKQRRHCTPQIAGEWQCAMPLHFQQGDGSISNIPVILPNWKKRLFRIIKLSKRQHSLSYERELTEEEISFTPKILTVHFYHHLKQLCTAGSRKTAPCKCITQIII